MSIQRILVVANLLLVSPLHLLAADAVPPSDDYVVTTRLVGTRKESSGQKYIAIDSIAGEVVLQKGESKSLFIVTQFAEQIQWYSWDEGEERRRNKEVTPAIVPGNPATKLPSWFNKVDVTRAKDGKEIEFKFYLQSIVPKKPL